MQTSEIIKLLIELVPVTVKVLAHVTELSMHTKPDCARSPSTRLHRNHLLEAVANLFQKSSLRLTKMLNISQEFH